MNTDLFRFIRVSRRLTQREFAEIIGVSHGLVAQIEAEMKRITPRVEKLVIESFKLSKRDIEKYKDLLKSVGV